MNIRNRYLATVPFDIYELQLFSLVAETKSFTKTAKIAGLTQSAITRQIQGMENSLGVSLFERSTRVVNLTEAGRFLFQQSAAFLQGVHQSVEQLQTKFNLSPPQIKVGISKTIGLAYLPGFFFRFRKKFPEIQTTIVQESSSKIVEMLESHELDVGIICLSSKPPRSLVVKHRFEDRFIAIAPNSLEHEGSKKLSPQKLQKQFSDLSWFFINKTSNTGKLLDQWMSRNNLQVDRGMEMDTFDVIVNLVGMGLGVSVVPYRTLSNYPMKKSIVRISLKPMFTRQLSIVTRKAREQPSAIVKFLENVLF